MVARQDRLIWAKEQVASHSRTTAFSRAVPQMASKCATVSRQVRVTASNHSSSRNTTVSRPQAHPLSAIQTQTATRSACTLLYLKRPPPRPTLPFPDAPQTQQRMAVNNRIRISPVKFSAVVELIRQTRRKIQMLRGLGRRAMVGV